MESADAATGLLGLAPAAPLEPESTIQSQGPSEPPYIPYDDTGSLVVQKVYYSSDGFSCNAWLSGIGQVPELSEVQPSFHPAFDLRFIPEAVVGVAGRLLEIDVETDPRNTGWSPGSMSLAGFARELTFWRTSDVLAARKEPTWARGAAGPPLTLQFVAKRWSAIRKDGLGSDWTEKKGYDQLRELIGPAQFSWVDPEESFKTRHQITDLLGAMSISILPSIERSASIGALANCDKITPNRPYAFVDFLLQLVLARELTLRMARDPRPWYGGVTLRVLYDMIAAELWARNMEPQADGGFEVAPEVGARQLGGIVEFVEQMEWPYAREIRETVTRLLGPDSSGTSIGVRVWDWMNGLVLPGGLFALTTIGTIYAMSPTLRSRLPSTTFHIRKGQYGIVYPQASYWCARSVLGKVLAPLSLAGGDRIKCIGGWVGPCPSPSLPGSTFGLMVELKFRPPLFASDEEDRDENVASTTTDPTGESKRGNAAKWTEPTPPPPPTDSVILQTLRLAKVAAAPTATSEDPPQYQARLDFRLAKSKSMVTITLHANSIFIAAPPCRGTHRIDPGATTDYTFRVLDIGDLPRAEPRGTAAVTVVNAAGGGAAETFARAWCSERGTNAVVWKRDGGKCCFKCALMMAGKEGVAAGVLIIC